MKKEEIEKIIAELYKELGGETCGKCIRRLKREIAIYKAKLDLIEE